MFYYKMFHQPFLHWRKLNLEILILFYFFLLFFFSFIHSSETIGCTRTFCTSNKYTLQSFSNAPFLYELACITSKLQIVYELSTYSYYILRDVHCIFWSCIQGMTAELWLQTNIPLSFQCAICAYSHA